MVVKIYINKLLCNKIDAVFSEHIIFTSSSQFFLFLSALWGEYRDHHTHWSMSFFLLPRAIDFPMCFQLGVPSRYSLEADSYPILKKFVCLNNEYRCYVFKLTITGGEKAFCQRRE